MQTGLWVGVADGRGFGSRVGVADGCGLDVGMLWHVVQRG